MSRIIVAYRNTTRSIFFYTRLDPCSLKIRWVNAALSAKTLIMLQLCEPDIATSKETKERKKKKKTLWIESFEKIPSMEHDFFDNSN